MKKVLVPTDFSSNAWDALTYAIRLYDDISCCFYILNTFLGNPSKIPSAAYQLGGAKVFKIIKKESEEGLQEILDHLNDNLLNDKHDYRAISKSGSLLSVVKSVVDQEGIDIIVMGTAGSTGAKEIFMGSNTVKIIKHLDLCPILSIPKNYYYKEPEQVVFATDFKRNISNIELNCLIELQLLHNFTIKVVHVKEGNQALSHRQLMRKKELQQWFSNGVLSFEEIQLSTTVTKTIYGFIKAHKIDIVCLTNYEHSFIEKLTREPIIKRMSFHSPIPVLIIPD